MRAGTPAAAVALTAAALALPLVGCGVKGKPKTVPADVPLCRPLSARVIGHVDDSAATELSGLVASRTQAGVLWTHNDSGDSARVIGIRLDGRSLGSFPVTGAQAQDWEDIATGPGRTAGRAYLYAGDIGDNLEQRSTIVIYRFPEPDVRSGPRPTAGAHPADAPLSRRLPRRRGAARRPAQRRPGGRHEAARRERGRVRGARGLPAARRRHRPAPRDAHRARSRAHGDGRRRLLGRADDRPAQLRPAVRLAPKCKGIAGPDARAEALRLAHRPRRGPGRGARPGSRAAGRRSRSRRRPPAPASLRPCGVVLTPSPAAREPSSPRVYWPHGWPTAATGGNSACRKWSSTV